MQVLARFEDFPSKKLEGLRMAAALYSKLEMIVTTLQNWKIVSPINQLLDKVENYFNKVKRLQIFFRLNSRVTMFLVMN